MLLEQKGSKAWKSFKKLLVTLREKFCCVSRQLDEEANHDEKEESVPLKSEHDMQTSRKDFETHLDKTFKYKPFVDTIMREINLWETHK